MGSLERVGRLVVMALFVSLTGCGATPPRDAEPPPRRGQTTPPPPRLDFADCAAGDSVRFVSGAPQPTPIGAVFGTLETGNVLGGGGTGLGTIGGSGSGYGRGHYRLGRRREAPKVRLGQSSASGALDKSIIRRFIRRQLLRIRYCYESQLIKHPGLAGKAVADFTIDPTGKVSRVVVSGFDEVRPCLEKVIGSIVFPKPRGGGIVKVRYPFVFRGAGGASAARPEPKPEPKPEPPPPPPPPPPREAGVIGVLKETRTVATPLAARRRQLAACLTPKSRGVAVLELALGDGAVTAVTTHGDVGDDVAACLADAGRRLRWSEKPGIYRCPIAFGEMPPGSAPGLDITERAVRAGGADLVAVASVATSRGWKIDPVYDVGRAQASGDVVSAPGPLVVRPVAATPMAVVSRVIRSLAAAGAGWALAAEAGGRWRLLRETALPAVPAPTSALSALVGRGSGGGGTISIFVGRVELWAGVSGGERRRFGAAGAGRDWKSVTAFLAALRESPARAERVDFEIAADPRVPYRDFVAAVDAARRAGLTDFGLVDRGSLTVRFFP